MSDTWGGTPWSDPRIERTYQSRVHDSVDGTCPTCNGTATIFLHPYNRVRGHIFCDEDECGRIRWDMRGVDQHIGTSEEANE